MPLDLAAEHLLRELAPQVLGVVVRRFRDFADAEDAVQEALIAATAQWPLQGLPDNPRAWLIQVAVRRFTDRTRRDTARRQRESLAGYPMASSPSAGDPEDDDTLLLFFMCCHQALSPSSAIALTLRAVGGLTTAEIASAYLVPESTMAQRISRSKQSIRASGVPFSVPAPNERAQRLREVLHVLYLVFNEGYTSSSGEQLQRPDLSAEAIRLTRIVHQRLPADPEVTGLLALMLLTDARRAARTGPSGELVSLDEQDRGLWNRDQIAEGVALISSALPMGAVGPYQLQAAIAAVHDESPAATETDWTQILTLYELLTRIADNPMVSLNHAIATAMVHGPAYGLRLLQSLESDGRVASNHRLHAVRAHLYQMLGDLPRAISGYRTAATMTASLPERNYLLRKAAECGR